MPCNTRFQSQTCSWLRSVPPGKVVLLPQTGHGRSLPNRCQPIIHKSLHHSTLHNTR